MSGSTVFAGYISKEFVLEALRDGHIRDLDELKAMAAKRGLTVPDGSSLGRVIHGALLGLRSNGQVISLGGGKWKIGKQNAPAD